MNGEEGQQTVRVIVAPEFTGPRQSATSTEAA